MNNDTPYPVGPLAAALLTLVIGLLPLQRLHAAGITPDHVYQQAVRIEQESEMIRRHLGLDGEGDEPVELMANLLPRHVWQKCYLIQLKVNFFRQQRGMPLVSANNLQPVRSLEPAQTYEQTRRLLTEIALIRERLGVEGEVGLLPPGRTMRPVDVYNRLHRVSLLWDRINRQPVVPPVVYAEVRRIDQDVDTLLGHLRIHDLAVPPAKVADATPADSINSAFALMDEVQRLQQQLGLAPVDFTPFRSGIDQVRPDDVLILVSMVIAELQTVKATLGLQHELTPPAELHGNQTPADVNQLLGYVTNKLRLIRSL